MSRYVLPLSEGVLAFPRVGVRLSEPMQETETMPAPESTPLYYDAATGQITHTRPANLTPATGQPVTTQTTAAQKDNSTIWLIALLGFFWIASK